ncbi:antibiotic biosynthesis protein [Streptomyces sp. SID685]|uniref:LmbU family transcriptional regulator n=1 Tax=Streptomyces sp. SID685 TaxID=2690322 RepID=UPI001369DB1F|nr:LmbU family transcriptional regulator [Streptomyces sp. SID685]MYR83675.1 antibiotic biosynthesis protein [Streptomyces sp. SID685]
MLMDATHEIHPPRTALSNKSSLSRPMKRRMASDGARRGQVLTTQVSLQIPDGLNFESWERAGRQLAGLVNSSAWWLGDWLVYGKDNYGDRYEVGIRAAGLKYQTLRNYAWVSRRFDSSRRRAMLSFQHHAEVASLLVNEQEHWLDSAEEMKWTTKQLRNAIQNSRESGVGKSPQVTAVRRLEVPDERIRQWRMAAERSGADLDAWVVATLDRAAERTLDDGEALVYRREVSA